MFEKIWDDHVVLQEPYAPAVLYIDLHLVHEVTSPQAFTGLRARGIPVRRADRTIATMDHSTPTTVTSILDVEDEQAQTQLKQLTVANTRPFSLAGGRICRKVSRGTE